LYFLVLDFIHGICNGFSIPVSQSFGAGDTTAIRRYIAGSIWLSFFIGLFLTVVLLFFTRPFLIWIKTPKPVLADAYRYIRILFAGTLILFFYNLPASILRALGDSKTPLTFLILSSFFNILLDLLFIVILQKGTAWAAADLFLFSAFFYVRKKILT
jgi:Na+-driven multidrug efflux pump